MDRVLHNPKRLPPFGKRLADRQKWNNPPAFCSVYVGASSWEKAKAWNGLLWNIETTDYPALVMPLDFEPGNYVWPVSGCTVVLHRLIGPDDDFIMALVKELLRCGATIVTIVNECHNAPARIGAKFWAKRPERKCL